MMELSAYHVQEHNSLLITDKRSAGVLTVIGNHWLGMKDESNLSEFMMFQHKKNYFQVEYRSIATFFNDGVIIWCDHKYCNVHILSQSTTIVTIPSQHPIVAKIQNFGTQTEIVVI